MISTKQEVRVMINSEKTRNRKRIESCKIFLCKIQELVRFAAVIDYMKRKWDADHNRDGNEDVAKHKIF